MTTYLFVSLFPYAGAIATAMDRRVTAIGWFVLSLFLIVLSLFIGLRFETGKDWLQYNYIYDVISSLPLGAALGFTDMGYSALNWICSQIGFGITGVFLICATVLAVGIGMFAAQTPYPWLAVAVTMPHIVTVMAMDHVRQATALGFILIGLALLAEDKVRPFLICILISALFHRTGIIFLGFGIGLITRNRMLLYPAFLLIAVVMLQYIMQSDRMDIYTSRYLESEAGSRGALIRLALNAAPAAAFLYLGTRLELPARFRKVMTLVAWAAILCVVLLPLSPSVVVIDRVGKYFLPIQILFFPMFIARFHGFLLRAGVTGLIVMYLATTQVYWLSSSPLARHYWVPYKMVGF
ncbi:EpsG family protein [Sagittula sp. NFXS13]|uniref:EpsG family protein n=1 Tax=Sagittula sp. NFXS13 TaxID=2819095 RepID=UPI0032DF0B4A